MKKVYGVVIGLSLACFVYFGVFFSYPTAKVTPKKASTSVTVKCKDGSEYTDKLSSKGDFKCSWKELVFNF